MKLERRDSRRERKLAVCLVMALILVVVFSIGVASYFSPENKAIREIEKLAREYYETYLYGSSISTFENGVEGMVEFSENGVQPVRLRQLLLYEGGKNKTSQELFESDAYRCDLDGTGVIYHPVAPYGVNDYTIEYEIACKKQA